MCRCRTSLIRGTKKGHGKISWPNPIGKHIQVLQQNPCDNCRAGRPPSVPLRAKLADWSVIFVADLVALLQKQLITHV